MAVRRQLVTGISGGVGLALTLTVLAAVWIWYTSRPRPWVSDALTSEYSHATWMGETISVYYDVRNNTGRDYKLEESDNFRLVWTFGDPPSISAHDESSFVWFDSLPIVIPAREAARLQISMSHPKPTTLQTGPGDKGHTSEVAKALSEEFRDIVTGFILFDESRRYRVQFPGGWLDSKK